MDIHGLESGFGKGCGHFDFAVNTLFAEDCDGRTGRVIVADPNVEGDFGRDAWVSGVEFALKLLFSAFGVVSQGGHAAGDVGPRCAEFAEALVKQDGVALGDGDVALDVQ